MATTSLADRAAAAEAAALRAQLERVESDAINARNTAVTEFYDKVANRLADEAKQARANTDTRIERLAAGAKPSLSDIWDAWLDRSAADAKCGAISTVSTIVTPPPPPNEKGVFPMPTGTRVSEKYRGDSFAQFVDAVVQRRGDKIRGRHIEELRDGATAAGKRAEAAARAAAAAG